MWFGFTKIDFVEWFLAFLSFCTNDKKTRYCKANDIMNYCKIIACDNGDNKFLWFRTNLLFRYASNVSESTNLPDVTGSCDGNWKPNAEWRTTHLLEKKSTRVPLFAFGRSITDPFVYYSLLVSARVSTLRSVLTHM